jgi:putative ABC transport system permease protein
LDWKEQAQSFEAMAAYSGMTANVSFQGEPTAIDDMRVTPDFFTVLRVAPLLGRTFNAADGVPKQDHSIILSYGLWKERFGGDSAVIGKKIEVNGEPTEVIGVMRPDFTYPNSKAAAWVPMALERTEAFKGGRFMAVLARLKPGVSLEQARQDMLHVARYTQKARPEMDKNWSATVYPMLEDATRDVRKPLWVLLAAVGFLLLIGCANVANLLLMRGTARMREMAVRSALGAGRSRIIQQLLIESVLLALAGMAAGLFFAYFGLQGLLALIPKAAPLPRGNVAIDGKVLLFTFVCSVITAILFGVVPALRLSHVELQDALRQGSVRTGGGGHQTLRRCFVVAEVSLALMLAVGAGLMLRSFAKLIAVDPGFQREQILTMNLFTSPARYSDDLKRSQYFTQLLEEIRNTPGVEAAGSTHFLPLTNMSSGSCFSRADGPEPTPAEAPGAQFLIISSGYFKTMGTTVLRGRDFTDRDTFGSQPVAMVNQAFAERYFPKEEILGKQLRVCWTIKRPVEIVGVTANARQAELQDAPEPTIFLSNAQAVMYFATLVVRATGDPSAIARSVEGAIHRVDPDQALSDVQTMDTVFRDSVSSPRLQAVLLLVFSGLAIALAMIGVYGVVSYSVSQRTNEIGIRIAMGAASDKIFGLVLREALILAAVALAIGLGGAVVLSRVLQTLLFEVAPTDPASLAAAGLIVLAVSALAAMLPAWRAMRVDPMVALRYE